MLDDRDLAVRRTTYALFADLGRAPSAAEVASGSDLESPDVERSWRRLHDAHALVLDAQTGAIRMAAPFSAVPTNYLVHAAGRAWYANCAWDAFGICAALHADGRIETSCLDCGESLTIDVEDEAPSDPSLLFHCLVPARLWWEDIVFT